MILKRRMTEENLYKRFLRHTGQLAIIFLWTSGNLFHVAWRVTLNNGLLTSSCLLCFTWDHTLVNQLLKLLHVAVLQALFQTMGVYEWWFTIGMRTNQDLYTGSVFLALVSALFLFAGWLHLHKLPTFIIMVQRCRISFKPPLIWSFLVLVH
jgi:photosystem I P700 chlorophyll a apoprotein A2